MNKLAEELYSKFTDKKFRLVLYTIWFVSIIFFVSQFPKLSVSFEFEQFFAGDSADIVFYQDHKEKFGYDNDYLLLAIINETSVFDTNFLSKVEGWRHQLDTLRGLTHIKSLFDFQHLVKSPYGMISIPLIHPASWQRLKKDSIRISNHPLYSSFISPDAKALIFQLNHQHFKRQQNEMKFYQSLISSLVQSEIDEYKIVGKLVAQKSFIEHIRSDFTLFLSLGIVVTIVLLLLIYKSFNVMLLPLIISISSLVYLLGLMALLQVELGILSVLIPPIILFVSTSDAVHLINAYRQSSDTDFLIRLQSSIKKVFSPTLLTSITTALGFLSLLAIPIRPIQELGLFSAVGVLIAFTINFIIGPLLIRKNYGQHRMQLPYRKWAVKLVRAKPVVLTTYIVLILISLFGFSKLKTDAYLLRDLPEDSEVRHDFSFLDKTFGGSKPWELAIFTSEESKSIWTYEFLKEAQKIERFLIDSFAIEKLVSPLDLVKYTNQIDRGGDHQFYKFPTSEGFAAQWKFRNKLIVQGAAKAVADSMGSYARFAGFIPEWGSSETQRRNSKLMNFIKKEIDSDVLQARITGTTYLIDKSNAMLSLQLLKGLVVAVLMVAVVLAVFFRSFKMLFISLIPNFIPLLFTAGIMGFAGVPLKLTTAIIFVVAFGIAVDDTIHFLGAYKKQKAVSPIWRIIKTFRSAGLAILITSILIIGGFVLFTLSSFATTFYLGLFLSLAMLFALVTDLTLLPLLLKKNN